MKTYPCLIKPHVMKTYGRVEAQLYKFFTLELGGGEWSASRFGRLSPRGIFPVSIDWIQASESVWKWWLKKYLCPYRESNTGRTIQSTD